MNSGTATAEKAPTRAAQLFASPSMNRVAQQITNGARPVVLLRMGFSESRLDWEGVCNKAKENRAVPSDTYWPGDVKKLVACGKKNFVLIIDLGEDGKSQGAIELLRELKAAGFFDTPAGDGSSASKVLVISGKEPHLNDRIGCFMSGADRLMLSGTLEDINDRIAAWTKPIEIDFFGHHLS